MRNIAYDIVSANDINYGNADEICGYQMLLSKMFEHAGGFDIPRKTNAISREIQSQGLIWLRNVKMIMKGILSSSNTTKLTLKAMPRLIESYYFLYRICNGTRCLDYIREVRFKTIDSFAKGNKDISQTAVILMLNEEISRNITSTPQRYFDYIGRITAKWVNELIDSGKLSDMSIEDVYLTLGFLLEQDLSAYGITKEDKFKWIERYSLSVDEIDALDMTTLRSYMSFAQCAMHARYASMEEGDHLYSLYISKIASRPDTNKFVREAIRMELANYETA